MIWWYQIWPGWLQYASELFNGLITLPVLLPAQIGLMWAWNRWVVKPQTRRQVAELVAARMPKPGRCDSLSPGSTPASTFGPTCRLTAGHAGMHDDGAGCEWRTR